MDQKNYLPGCEGYTKASEVQSLQKYLRKKITDRDDALDLNTKNLAAPRTLSDPTLPEVSELSSGKVLMSGKQKEITDLERRIIETPENKTGSSDLDRTLEPLVVNHEEQELRKDSEKLETSGRGATALSSFLETLAKQDHSIQIGSHKESIETGRAVHELPRVAEKLEGHETVGLSDSVEILDAPSKISGLSKNLETLGASGNIELPKSVSKISGSDPTELPEDIERISKGEQQEISLEGFTDKLKETTSTPDLPESAIILESGDNDISELPGASVNLSTEEITRLPVGSIGISVGQEDISLPSSKEKISEAPGVSLGDTLETISDSKDINNLPEDIEVITRDSGINELSAESLKITRDQEISELPGSSEKIENPSEVTSLSGESLKLEAQEITGLSEDTDKLQGTQDTGIKLVEGLKRLVPKIISSLPGGKVLLERLVGDPGLSEKIDTILVGDNPELPREVISLGGSDISDLPSDSISLVGQEEVNLPNTRLDISSEDVDLPNTRLDISSEDVDLPNTRLDIEGNEVDLPNTRLDISSEDVDLPNTRLDIKGNEVDSLPEGSELLKKDTRDSFIDSDTNHKGFTESENLTQYDDKIEERFKERSLSNDKSLGIPESQKTSSLDHISDRDQEYYNFDYRETDSFGSESGPSSNGDPNYGSVRDRVDRYEKSRLEEQLKNREYSGIENDYGRLGIPESQKTENLWKTREQKFLDTDLRDGEISRKPGDSDYTLDDPYFDEVIGLPEHNPISKFSGDTRHDNLDFLDVDTRKSSETGEYLEASEYTPGKSPTSIVDTYIENVGSRLKNRKLSDSSRLGIPESQETTDSGNTRKQEYFGDNSSLPESTNKLPMNSGVKSSITDGVLVVSESPYNPGEEGTGRTLDTSGHRPPQIVTTDRLQEAMEYSEGQMKIDWRWTGDSSKSGVGAKIGGVGRGKTAIPAYQMGGGFTSFLNPSKYLRWLVENTVGCIPLKGSFKQVLLDETLGALIAARDLLEKTLKIQYYRLPGSNNYLVDTARYAMSGVTAKDGIWYAMKLVENGLNTSAVIVKNPINRPSKDTLKWSSEGGRSLDDSEVKGKPKIYKTLLSFETKDGGNGSEYLHIESKNVGENEGRGKRKKRNAFEVLKKILGANSGLTGYSPLYTYLFEGNLEDSNIINQKTESQINLNSSGHRLGFYTTISNLCYSNSSLFSSYEDLRERLECSPYLTTSRKLYGYREGDIHRHDGVMTLDSNHVWEIVLEPYVGLENGMLSYLPSIHQINYENYYNFGLCTNWDAWIPFTGFELNYRKLQQKSIQLYTGEISIPKNLEFTNELRLTICDDQFKSWKRYFEYVMYSSIYKSDPKVYSYYNTKKFLRNLGQSLTKGNDLFKNEDLIDYDFTNVRPSPYKNLAFRCMIFSMTPQYQTIHLADLLVVLKDFTEEWQGEVDASPTELALMFSVVGENPLGIPLKWDNAHTHSGPSAIRNKTNEELAKTIKDSWDGVKKSKEDTIIVQQICHT